jgi:hypothetical protein
MPLTPLIVRGIMCVLATEQMPYQPLPELHTVISFCGELVSIENGITVVAVCDHSYFNFLDEAVDESQFHHVF